MDHKSISLLSSEILTKPCNAAIGSDYRLQIPVSLRQAFKKKGKWLMLTKGLSSCIFIFSKDEWLDFEDRLKCLPWGIPPVRSLYFLIMKDAAQLFCGSRFRVSIPGTLLRFARIRKKALIAEHKGRFEVWNPGLFKKYASKRYNIGKYRIK